MNRNRASWYVLLALAAAVVQPVTLSLARDSDSLEKLVLQASHDKQHIPSSAEELMAVEKLFLQTLQHPEQLDQLAAAWAAYRWEFLRLGEAHDELWVVREAPGHAYGRGCYVIRPHTHPGFVLQTPHSFADKYTRDLALRLFAEGEFAAASWNTVHRNIVDLAHTADHPLGAFTRAVVKAHPQAYVLQLHGFGREQRKTAAGRVADLVISNGSASPARFVREAAVLFESRFPYGQSRLFPTQIRELGAMTNAQAHIMEQLGTHRFIHLEMSAPLRRRLLADPHARSLLLKNLRDSTD